MSVRPAKFSDLTSIKLLAEEYQHMVYGKSTPRTLEEINEIALIRGTTFVYDISNTIAGFITITIDVSSANPNQNVNVDVDVDVDVMFRLIVVSKDFQGQGIGHKLMKYAISRFNNRNCVLIIDKKNPIFDFLIGFYARYGFIVIDINSHSITMKLIS
jgi:GNAT superfamily N-acetyltransferase